MALLTIANPTLPNQNLGAGDDLALAIEEFTGLVEGTIERRAKFAPFINFRPVRGTSTITNEGIGKSTLQKITKGEAPDPTINEAARINLTVDTTIIARNWVAQIDDFQKNYAFKQEVAKEHGKEISKFLDQAVAIQAAKAAALTASSFGALPGHQGGSTETLATAADLTDPAALYSAIGNLLAKMEEKDVDPQADGVMLALAPKAFYALLDAEQIVNGTYVTANGKEVVGAKLLKAWGIPVISTNNIPNTNITSHFLSNTRNGNAFNGDFTKLGAVAFSPDALLAGETIPLSATTWWDELTKGFYIDAWLAFSATANRAEYAGRIVLP